MEESPLDTLFGGGSLNFWTKLLTEAYERENNWQKSLAGIELAKQPGKHLGPPAGRAAQKVAKVVKALESGLSVAEIVTLTSISRASVKLYATS